MMSIKLMQENNSHQTKSRTLNVKRNIIDIFPFHKSQDDRCDLENYEIHYQKYDQNSTYASDDVE